MDILQRCVNVAKNALQFYKNLWVERSAGAYVALGCAAVVALFVFFFILIDYRRGGSRAMVRLLFSGLALVIAFLGTCIVGRAGIFDKSIGSIPFLKLEAFEPLLNAYFSAIVLPFVFCVAFLICNWLMGIPHGLICGILGFTYRRNNTISRLAGALIGVFHGVFISIVLLLPCFALIKPYADVAKKPSPDQAAAVSFYENYLEDTAESPLYRYTMRFGGNKLLREIEEGNLADVVLDKLK